MGDQTEHIRKLRQGVEESKRLTKNLKSICQEIDAMLEKGKTKKLPKLPRKPGGS
jgi:hypothetical protein